MEELVFHSNTSLLEKLVMILGFLLVVGLVIVMLLTPDKKTVQPKRKFA